MFNRVHPTCRPLEREAMSRNSAENVGRADDEEEPHHDEASRLPSFASIMSRRVHVLKHVPKTCRLSWAQALTRALARASTYNTLEAWTELLMLPKTVLVAPGRRGRKHKHKAAAFTMDRLSRWEARERASLWEDLPAPYSRPHKQQSDEQRIKHAISLCREGFDRKACAALVAGEVCEESEDTAQLLAPLHPQAPAPHGLPVCDFPWGAEITPGAVSKVLKSFPWIQPRAPQGPASNTCWKR